MARFPPKSRISPPKVFHGWGWNGEDPPVLVCLAGCPRVPHYLPRPLDVDEVPSSLVPHDAVRAGRPEIDDSPCRKLAFSMARRGDCVGQEGRAHAGKCLPMCPWPLGTLQAQPLGCEVRNGRASHSTPAEGAGFWPDFSSERCLRLLGNLVQQLYKFKSHPEVLGVCRQTSWFAIKRG